MCKRNSFGEKTVEKKYSEFSHKSSKVILIAREEKPFSWEAESFVDDFFSEKHKFVCKGKANMEVSLISEIYVISYWHVYMPYWIAYIFLHIMPYWNAYVLSPGYESPNYMPLLGCTVYIPSLKCIYSISLLGYIHV